MTLVRTQQIVYGVKNFRDAQATTAEVELTHPTAGATTQEDANQIFDARLTVLETEPIDGGVY